MSIIVDALEFAEKAHSGQTRMYSGEPYILHPAQVANLVRQYTSNDEVIAAAYLHDVLEDCGVTEEEIRIRFGDNITKICLELVNRSVSPEYKSLRRSERKAIDREKIATISPDAQLIKTCDRLDNVLDLFDAPDKYQKLYAEETLLLVDVLTKAPTVLVEAVRGSAQSVLKSFDGA
jgi:(p)ppGpp synthase/HD superfamily hydrolase